MSSSGVLHKLRLRRRPVALVYLSLVVIIAKALLGIVEHLSSVVNSCHNFYLVSCKDELAIAIQIYRVVKGRVKQVSAWICMCMYRCEFFLDDCLCVLSQS